MTAREYFFKKFGIEITVETHPAYYVAPRVYFDLMDEYAKLKETYIILRNIIFLTMPCILKFIHIYFKNLNLKK